jgi:hypothetical protein
MKKEFPDNTTMFSFFIRISCKTNNNQSVQCKQSASWPARPLSNFFRAFIVKLSTDLISSEIKKDACKNVAQMLYIKHVSFDFPLYKLKSGHRLK